VWSGAAPCRRDGIIFESPPCTTKGACEPNTAVTISGPYCAGDPAAALLGYQAARDTALAIFTTAAKAGSLEAYQQEMFDDLRGRSKDAVAPAARAAR